jgi:hypothetical protein
MNATVTKHIEVYGIEIQVEAEFSYDERSWSEPFEHFGFRGSYQEGETTFEGFESGVFIADNLSAAVIDTLKARGWRRNRRFKKRARQLERAIESHLESLNPENLWDENDCLDALN